MSGSRRIGPGDVAPDFAVAGTDGTPEGHRTYTLSEFRGRPVVLAFYPADNSPVCKLQLSAYSSSVRDLELVGAQVLGLSPQSIESHDEFVASGGLSFPLLADRDKSVGEAYGVLGPLGFYRRCLFVVDQEGILRFAHRSVTSLTYQPVDVIADVLRGLPD
jgi:peroxiredoxin Q/BCP